MKKNLSLFPVIILFVLTLSSCTWFASESECEKILDRRTMTNVLTDVFLLEAQITNQTAATEIRDSIPNYYAGIFNKYNITQKEFEEAYECYLLDQENMTRVMDEVLSALSIQQSKIDEKKEETE
ncbi:MAG: DUF4296 domain-containing protein [Bacteroidota bacterium]